MTILTSNCNPHDPQFTKNKAVYERLISDLREKFDWALAGGGEKIVARHRERGKLLARDRIDLLVDPLTPFLELSPLAALGLYNNGLPSAGIVTGIGTIRGVICVIIANDATVKGGSFYKETVRKHIRAQDIALENDLPVIYLVDCGGANLESLEDVFPDQDHFGGTFYRQCRMSAKGLPQLAAVFGECTAGGAYIPALCDEFVMVAENSSIHLGGPQIVEAAISEIIGRDDLGGAWMHSTQSGVSDHFAVDEKEAIAKLRDMVGAINYPQTLHGDIQPPRPPRYDPAELIGIASVDLTIPVDQREIVARLVDDSAFHEFKPLYGATLLCGFAHIEGLPVGIIANNGVLMSESTLKGVHFIELCDQRNIPLLFLQNTTGFMVGSEAERNGIAKNSAKLVYAVSNSRVPRYTLVTGGSYGAGNYGMSGRGFRPRFMFMWPNARLGGMSPDVGSSVLMDLRRASISKKPATKQELAEYEQKVRNMFEEKSAAYYCTARIWDDGIIEPADTRQTLALCLAVGVMQAPETGYRPVYRM